jgi:acyl-CoA synthetase (AMP-forming)/AMP-acid ligase II
VATPTRLDDLLFGPAAPADGIAVTSERGSLTWDELRARATALSDELGARGVAGHAVAVEHENTADAVTAWFAVWRAGGVVVAVNPRLADDEKRHILEDTGAVVQLSARGVEPLEVDTLTFDDTIALLSFTSGTTGRPRPVPLRHDRVLALMDGVLSTIRGGAQRGGDQRGGDQRGGSDRSPMPNLVPVSLSLWAGIYNVLVAFLVGAPVVLMERFDTHRFAELVREHGIRSTVLPPPAMVMLADDDTITDLVPLKLVRSISAPLSPLQARRFRDRFGITVLNGYGQTELGGEVVGWSAADGREFGETKLGAVGRPHAGVECRVIDNEGNVLGPDEVGALEVRAAGRASEGIDLSDRLSADGFLRTGDLGRIDADGFVWIEGRESDMVNRGGLKVFPAEVEEVLRLHPAVTDAVVVGEPDDRLGEIPVAYVVSAGTLDADDLASHTRSHLAPYKVPLRFVAVDAIPRNEAGKVQRHLLT